MISASDTSWPNIAKALGIDIAETKKATITFEAGQPVLVTVEAYADVEGHAMQTELLNYTLEPKDDE